MASATREPSMSSERPRRSMSQLSPRRSRRFAAAVEPSLKVTTHRRTGRQKGGRRGIDDPRRVGRDERPDGAEKRERAKDDDADAQTTRGAVSEEGMPAHVRTRGSTTA